MKARTSFLLLFVLALTLNAISQERGIEKPSVKKSETIVDLQRTIRFERNSKPEEVIININPKTQRVELAINGSVTMGKLTIELFDPNDLKQGNFTIGTQLSADKQEMVNGNIRKSLNEPLHGNWKVKIIPSNATANIRIQTAVFD